MCKYCENGKPFDTDAMYEQDEYFGLYMIGDMLMAYVNDESTDKYYEVGVYFKYCPMCGRDLRECS